MIDEGEIDKKCFFGKWGKSNVNMCRLSCAGNKKTAPSIKPINKQSPLAVCRCITWPAEAMDKQEKCHWRIGSILIDDISQPYYMENFYCNNPKPPATEAPEEETDEKLVTELDLFRIPPNLVCPQINVVSNNDGDRIVGGVEALAHSWPWVVNMAFGSFMCAGTLIDSFTVLTAAHCCSGYQYKPEYVRGTIGDHHWMTYEDGQKTFTAKSIIIHPNYSKRTIANDICIVKFGNMGLEAHPTAAHACLPEEHFVPAHNTKCWTAGWGVMSNGRAADVLQEVDLQIISNQECEKTRNSGYIIDGAMICAGWLEGGKDGCQGDSGGPLICTDSTGKQPVLTGITSWGFGCGQPNSPGVWTQVSSYVDWISKHMG